MRSICSSSMVSIALCVTSLWPTNCRYWAFCACDLLVQYPITLLHRLPLPGRYFFPFPAHIRMSSLVRILTRYIMYYNAFAYPLLQLKHNNAFCVYYWSSVTVNNIKVLNIALVLSLATPINEVWLSWKYEEGTEFRECLLLFRPEFLVFPLSIRTY
jgi:hypothetical protein